MRGIPRPIASYHGANFFAEEITVKRLVLALIAITVFLTTAALPSMADGNPEGKCNVVNCPQ